MKILHMNPRGIKNAGIRDALGNGHYLDKVPSSRGLTQVMKPLLEWWVYTRVRCLPLSTEPIGGIVLRRLREYEKHSGTRF